MPLEEPFVFMPPETTSSEQAVSRTIRDNLSALQRLGDELQQALSDLVSACASSRPANALPPLIRAQSASASLQASLDVLARFIAMAMPQPGRTTGAEEILRMIGMSTPAAVEPPSPSIPAPMPAAPVEAPAALVDPPQPFEESYQEALSEVSPVAPPSVDSLDAEPQNGDSAAAVAAAESFDIATLPTNLQDLHKRANRVAKVSMQDIKMLKPKDVVLGRQNRDLCPRLRDDIERARKEYDRRFHDILDHPVDYFYHWMVEILAEGDPGALGEYPYPSPVLRH